MGARRSYAQLPIKSEILEGSLAARNPQPNRTPAALAPGEDSSGDNLFRYANPNETPNNLKDTGDLTKSSKNKSVRFLNAT